MRLIRLIRPICYLFAAGLTLFLSTQPTLAFNPPPRSSILKLFLRRTKIFTVTKEVKRADGYATAKNGEEVEMVVTLRNQGASRNVWVRDWLFPGFGWVGGVNWSDCGGYACYNTPISVGSGEVKVLNSYRLRNNNPQIYNDVLYSQTLEVSSDFWGGNQNGPFYAADVGYVLQPGETNPLAPNVFLDDKLTSGLAQVTPAGAPQYYLGDVAYALKAGSKSPAQLSSATVEVALEDDPTKYYVADTAYALKLPKSMIQFEGGAYGQTGISSGVIPTTGASTGVSGAGVGSPVSAPFPNYLISPNATAKWDKTAPLNNIYMNFNVASLEVRARDLSDDKLGPGQYCLNDTQGLRGSCANMYDPSGGVWHKKGGNGNLTLGNDNPGQGEQITFRDEGTIIVDGNLYINANIALTGINQRVGFIVKGDVIVNPKVTSLEGAYFVPNGTMNLGTGSAITLKGSFVANEFTMAGRTDAGSGYSVIAQFDGILSENPPPGFAKLLSTTVNLSEQP